MPISSLIYEWTLILYALSVLGYFIDFLQNNRKVNRIAFWLLSIVWILQTIYFILSFFELNRFPVVTPVEGLYFFAWTIVSLSLIINWFSRIDFFVFFANVIGFMLMSLHLFSPRDQVSPELAQQLSSELMLIHITMAFLSYAAFSLSFVFSVMYLIQYEMLKNKKWGRRLIRFGDLPHLEKMSYYFVMIGVPTFLLSVILGLIWGHITIEPFNYLDAKVILSFIVLIVYSYYLYTKVGKRQQGVSLALLNSAAFLVVLINIFLPGSLTGFHIWNE